MIKRKKNTQKSFTKGSRFLGVQNSKKITKKNLGILKFFIFLALIALITYLTKQYNLSSLLSPTMIRENIMSYGMLAPAAFILIYILATVFFVPGTPLTIASGIAFGSVLGTFYTVIGATIGATIAFFIARFLGEDFVESILKDKFKKLYEWDQKLESSGLPVVLFLRIAPIFPFNGLNFALGLTRVKARDYIIGTLVGIIPGSFVLAYFGNAVTEFSIMGIIFAVLLFLALVFSWPCYNYYCKRKGNKK